MQVIDNMPQPSRLGKTSTYPSKYPSTMQQECQLLKGNHLDMPNSDKLCCSIKLQTSLSVEHAAALQPFDKLSLFVR